MLLRVKALCSEKEGEGEVRERLPGETWGVEDVDKGGNSSEAAAVRPAYGNPDLGAWGWAGGGRCNCYISEPEHAQQSGSQSMKHSMKLTGCKHLQASVQAFQHRDGKQEHEWTHRHYCSSKCLITQGVRMLYCLILRQTACQLCIQKNQKLQLLQIMYCNSA